MVFVDNKKIRKNVNRKLKEKKTWLSNHIEDISREPKPWGSTKLCILIIVLVENTHLSHIVWAKFF